jgi:hypothetical protein
LPGVQYIASCDTSSGSGSDAFACAIGHKARDEDRDLCVIDFILVQRPPFNPVDLIAALAEHLKGWGIHEVMGDQYGKPFISIFAKNGISYVTTPIDTSAVYLHALPVWTSNSVLMLDHQVAIDQTANLRRKLGSGGRETVDHPRGLHDDIAVVIAGLIYRLTPVEQVAWDYSGIGVVTSVRDYVGESDEQSETWKAWLATQNYGRAPDGGLGRGNRSRGGVAW